MAIRLGGETPGTKKKALETLDTKPRELGVSGGKSVASTVVKTIIKDAPAVIRGVRKTIAATRKVSSADAKVVAAKTVGKSPTGSQLKFKQIGTGLSKTEKTAVKIKAPVQKIQSAAGGKTQGQIAVERSNAAAARRVDLQKKLQPPKRVVTKANTSVVTGTVSKPKNVLTYVKNNLEVTRKAPTGTTTGKGVDMSKLNKGTAQDVKDIVVRRTERAKQPIAQKTNIEKSLKQAADNPKNSFAKSRQQLDTKKYAQREARDAQAAREGQEAETSARKQWTDSQRSPKTVQNPVNERGTVAKVNEQASTGIKESNAAEKKRIVTKAPPKSNVLGGQHAGGHSDVASTLGK